MEPTMVDILAVLDEIARRSDNAMHGLDNGGAVNGRGALRAIGFLAKDTARWARERYDQKES